MTACNGRPLTAEANSELGEGDSDDPWGAAEDMASVKHVRMRSVTPEEEEGDDASCYDTGEGR